MRKYAFKILSIFLLCIPLFLDAQNDRKTKLEKQKIQLQDEIELANKILKETRADRETSLSGIETVEQKLRLRESLIRTLSRETEILEKESQNLQNEIDTLESEVTKLRADYGEMIRQARKSQSQHSRLMFIFSSESFNQALKRIEYLKQIADFRKRQVAEIQKKEAEKTAKLDELRVQKVRKEALLAQRNAERDKLASEKREQEKSIANLKDKESEITKSLKEKQAAAARLDNEIQRIIAAEIRRAKERAVRLNLETDAKKVGLIAGKDFTNRTNNRALEKLISEKRTELKAANKPVEEPTAKTAFAMTPEATQLAANFAANKSRLPWPVERGIVISGFGPQRHPIAKSVIINNNGIDIATEQGSRARTAFDGTVTEIIRVPGEGFVVFVQHGNYFTIYKNLVELFVKKGEEVTGKQEIGLIRTNETENKTVLHFELWKEMSVEDPMPWLARK